MLKVLCALALTVLAIPAHAEVRCMWFGNTCELLDNRGGTVAEFDAAITDLRSKGARVVIRGGCWSACTILADRLRSQVCLGDSFVTMHFHKVRVREERTIQYAGENPFVLKGAITSAWDPSYSADITGWIRAQGGLKPAEITGDFLDMSHAEASRIWRDCN